MSLITGIVMPCFNEAKRLPLKEIKMFLDENPEIHIIFVNDGSRDDTLNILNNFCNSQDNTEVLDLKKNQGKAEAVRQGLLTILNSNQYDLLGYWDADLSTPLNELNRMIPLFETNSQLHLLLGSRVKILGHKISRKLTRHYIGRLFATFASILLKLPVYDTQCGSKLFRAKGAYTIFNRKFTTKWVFDVELLMRYHHILKQQFKEEDIENMIQEMPLKEWRDVGGSKISLIQYFKASAECIKLIFIKVFKLYD